MEGPINGDMNNPLIATAYDNNSESAIYYDEHISTPNQLLSKVGGFASVVPLDTVEESNPYEEVVETVTVEPQVESNTVLEEPISTIQQDENNVIETTTNYEIDPVLESNDNLENAPIIETNNIEELPIIESNPIEDTTYVDTTPTNYEQINTTIENPPIIQNPPIIENPLIINPVQKIESTTQIEEIPFVESEQIVEPVSTIVDTTPQTQEEEVLDYDLKSELVEEGTSSPQYEARSYNPIYKSIEPEMSFSEYPIKKSFKQIREQFNTPVEDNIILPPRVLVPVENTEYIPMKKVRYLKKTKVVIPKVKKVIVPKKKIVYYKSPKKIVYYKSPEKKIIPIKTRVYRSPNIVRSINYNIASPNLVPVSSPLRMSGEINPEYKPRQYLARSLRFSSK